MNKNVTFTQTMFSIVLFCFGSSVVTGISTGVGQDAWISMLLAALLSIPILLVYARILRLFPGKDLFWIMETLFGKIAGKAFTVLFVWYSIHLCALVLRNFTEFTQITAMPETPQLPIMVLMILTTAYLAKNGMQAIGKWSIVMFFLVISVVLLTFGASLPQLELDALLPVGEYPLAQFAETSFQIFSFPFAECVVFLCLAHAFPKKASPYKLFLYALLATLIIFLLVFLRNLTLLGLAMMQSSYFPSYVAVRIIELGDFFSRIEGSISSNFLLAGITKIAVCLLAASKGFASLFNLQDDRQVLLPTGMLAMALCAILYKNAMDMFEFMSYYPYYAFPFQVIIPLVVWIGGEIYVKKTRSSQA